MIKCRDLNELFLLIGQDKLEIKDIVKASYPDLKRSYNIIKFFINLKRKIQRSYKYSLSNVVKKDINLHFADCCYPVNGEEAIEFLDKDKGYGIHRANCNKIKTYYERDYQISHFNWKYSNDKFYHSKLILLISNKIGSLREVVNCIFDLKINMINVTTTNKFEDFFECSVIIEVTDINQLENLMAQLNSLKLLHSLARYMQN